MGMFRTHWREHPRNRNTGPDRSTERAIIEYDLFSRKNICCNCAERRWKSIKIVLRPIGRAEGQLIEKMMNLLSGKNPIRQLKFQFFEVQCKHLSICHRFSIHIRQTTVGAICGYFPPVCIYDYAFKVINRIAGSVQSSNQSAIAHPHNQIDGYPLALEYAQHADMCASTRAASAEHERDTGFLFCKSRKRA